MSWSGSVSNAPGSGTNVPESIEEARESAKSASVDEGLRETRDKVIDAQLDCIAAAVEAVGETRIVSVNFHGHLNVDGSGTFGLSGSLGVPVAATAPEAKS